MSIKTDSNINDWIKQVLEGNINAFRKILSSYQSYVFAVSLKMMGDTILAEEVVQDTFIKVWQGLKSFNQTNNFKTWLYKIAVNVCLDKMKAQKRKRKLFSDNWEDSVLLKKTDNTDLEQALINQEYACLISVLVEKLTPKQRVVFTLVELECLTVSETTVITNLSPNQIKSNLHLAKKKIRSQLFQWNEK